MNARSDVHGEDAAEHLVAERTDRGFSWLPPLPDTYGDNAVRVLESSSAESPCLWLRVGNIDDDGEGVQSVAHLSAEQAWQLKEQIEWLLEHHYQGDARPRQFGRTRETAD